MNREELTEVLDEYEDANSAAELVRFLTDKLIEELENFPADSDKQKHELNLMIRDLEEDLDWIESDKLAEFDPEQQ